MVAEKGAQMILADAAAPTFVQREALAAASA
jgi:choline dehydrogenase